MLVKLQTTKFLIYAELDKTERITHLAAKNRIRLRTCYAILHEIEQCGDFHVTWGFADDGYSDTVRIHEWVDCVPFCLRCSYNPCGICNPKP